MALGPQVFGHALLSMLALLLAPNARAEAQREVVEDSWAAAEARMAAEDPQAGPPPSALHAPTRSSHRPSWRERRRAARERRQAEHDAELAAMAAASQRAHWPSGGRLRVELRAPRDLDWIWLGRDAHGPWHFRFTRGPSVCHGSCTLHIEAGRYAVGVRSSSLHGAVSHVLVDRSGRLIAHYHSGNAQLGGGISLMVVGMAALVLGSLRAMAEFIGFCDSEFETCETHVPLYAKVAFFGGVAVLCVGVALVFTTRHRLRLELRPFSR